VAVSAVEGTGLEELMDHIKTYLDKDRTEYAIKLPISDGKWLSWLHRHGEIKSDRTRGAIRYLKVMLGDADYARFNISRKAEG